LKPLRVASRKAAGSKLPTVRRRGAARGVSDAQKTGMASSQNSASACRHAPQGVAGAVAPPATAKARKRRAPALTAAANAARSAHSVSP
jgi:hypothetical protein